MIHETIKQQEDHAEKIKVCSVVAGTNECDRRTMRGGEAARILTEKLGQMRDDHAWVVETKQVALGGSRH